MICAWTLWLKKTAVPFPSQISLGTINIISPDRLFELPGDISQPLNLQFGDLATLHGYDLLSPPLSRRGSRAANAFSGRCPPNR
ncbi:MAG: hypothetical protein H6656_13740 [Ardenticatenaceae bacterium]|nr:hypothetical protein [Ardenticatenaceae bacterium]